MRAIRPPIYLFISALLIIHSFTLHLSSSIHHDLSSPIHSYIYDSFIHLFICPRSLYHDSSSIYHSSIHPSIISSIQPSIYLSICLSVTNTHTPTLTQHTHIHTASTVL